MLLHDKIRRMIHRSVSVENFDHRWYCSDEFLDSNLHIMHICKTDCGGEGEAPRLV